jgi:hypothetical protein
MKAPVAPLLAVTMPAACAGARPAAEGLVGGRFVAL